MRKVFDVFLVIFLIVSVIVNICCLSNITSDSDINPLIELSRASETIAKAIVEEKYSSQITNNTLYATWLWDFKSKRRIETSVVFDPDESILKSSDRSSQILENSDVKVIIHIDDARISIEEK